MYWEMVQDHRNLRLHVGAVVSVNETEMEPGGHGVRRVPTPDGAGATARLIGVCTVADGPVNIILEGQQEAIPLDEGLSVFVLVGKA